MKSSRDPGGDYRLLFAANPIPMWVFDTETLQFLEVNEAAVALYGFGRDEFLGMNIAAVRPQEDVPAARAGVQAPKATGLGKPVSERHRRKDGTVLTVQISAKDVVFGEHRARLVLAHEVSKRERGAGEASKKEQFLQSVLDGMPDVVFVKDRERRFILVNTAWERFNGVPRDQAIGKTPEDLFPVDVADRMRRADLATFEADSRTEMELTLPTDRGPRTYLSSRFPLRGQEGGIEGLVGLSVDITERKRAEERLQEYERVVEGLEEMILVVNRDYRCLLANRAFLHRHGPARDEVLGRLMSEVLNKGVFEGEVKKRLDECLEGKVVRYEMRYHFPKLGERDLSIAYFPIEGSAGVDRVACVLYDVTERSRARAALQRADAFAESVIQTANVIFLHLDRAGVVLRVNAAAEEITGYTPAEVEGVSWFEFLVPRDRYPSAWEEFERLMKEGVTAGSFENPILTKQGEERQIMWRNTTLREGDQIVGIIAFGMDVTDRRRAEEQQALLSRVVEQATESIIITDPQGTMIYVNPAFESVSGYSRGEAINQNPRILKSGHQDPAFYGRMWDTLARGEVWKGRMVNRRKDGALFQEDATIGPVRDAFGRLVNYVAVKRDVTNEMRLERQLLQAQKMEAVGRLAGGVAHDFNNLLSVIMGYSEVTLGKLGDDDPLRGKVHQIIKAAERAAGLTRQLLAFSRQQVLQPRIVDLNALVSDLEKMLQRLIGEDVELKTSLDPGLGRVKVDPGQIEQVLMNLAVNGRDAMPDGGRLTIETRNAEFGPEEAARRPPTRPGPYVMFAVSDNGTGMDAETQSHLFEPFFTTKELGKGTGLGLSTVYGIVKQSEGYVWFYSEVGVGTTFKVYLPRVDEEDVPGQKRALAPLARGSETLLLIEDAPSLRDLLCETLEGAGYTVLVADSGAKALQISDEYAGAIHLIVTDVIMPGLSGRRAADRIKSARGEVKILFISGYTNEAIARHGVLEPEANFLSKPFTSDDFLRKVREVLERPLSPLRLA